MLLDWHSFASRGDQFEIKLTRDNAGRTIGAAAAVNTTSVDKDCTPRIHNQRVPIRLSLLVVVAILSRSNDKTLVFNRSRWIRKRKAGNEYATNNDN